MIKRHIKEADIKMQYMDNEIMTKHEMSFNDLKALSQDEKRKLVKMDYSYN